MVDLRSKAKSPNFGLGFLPGSPVAHVRQEAQPTRAQLDAAELVAPLVRIAENHHDLAARLLGRPDPNPNRRHWSWHDDPGRDYYELVHRGRHAVVRSREGLLREACVIVLAAELADAPDELLAPAAVLIASGAVEVGAAVWTCEEGPLERQARQLALTSPYDRETCLRVLQLVGPGDAPLVLEAAAAAATDPLLLARELLQRRGRIQQVRTQWSAQDGFQVDVEVCYPQSIDSPTREKK